MDFRPSQAVSQPPQGDPCREKADVLQRKSLNSCLKQSPPRKALESVENNEGVTDQSRKKRRVSFSRNIQEILEFTRDSDTSDGPFQGLDKLLYSTDVTPQHLLSQQPGSNESRSEIQQDFAFDDDDMELTCVGNQQPISELFEESKLSLGNHIQSSFPLSLKSTELVVLEPGLLLSNSPMELTCQKYLPTVACGDSDPPIVNAGHDTLALTTPTGCDEDMRDTKGETEMAWHENDCDLQCESCSTAYMPPCDDETHQDDLNHYISPLSTAHGSSAHNSFFDSLPGFHTLQQDKFKHQPARQQVSSSSPSQSLDDRIHCQSVTSIHNSTSCICTGSKEDSQTDHSLAFFAPPSLSPKISSVSPISSFSENHYLLQNSDSANQQNTGEGRKIVNTETASPERISIKETFEPNWLEYMNGCLRESQLVLPWKLKLHDCGNQVVFCYPQLELTVGLDDPVTDIDVLERQITSTTLKVVSAHVNCFTEFAYGLIREQASGHCNCTLQHIAKVVNDVGLLVRQAQALGRLLWDMSMKHLIKIMNESSLLMEWCYFDPPQLCAATFTIRFHKSGPNTEVRNCHVKLGSLTEQEMKGKTDYVVQRICEVVRTASQHYLFLVQYSK